jgi:hypothetical protein
MMRLLAAVWRDPALRMVAGGAFLFGAFASSVGIHQSLLAVEVFGLSDARYAMVLFAATAVAVATSVAIGVHTDRSGDRRRMAALAVGASLAGAALVGVARAPWAFVLAHVILLPVGASIFGQLFALGRLASGRYPPHLRDGLLAVLRAFFAVPFVVMLPIWGRAFDRGLPLLAIYPAVAGLAAAHLLLTLRAWPADGRRWGDGGSGLGLAASLREIAEPGVLVRTALVGAIHAPGAMAGVILGLSFAKAGRPTGDVGLFFAAFVAIEILATLSLGWLLRWAPRLLLVALGVVTYAAFLACLPFAAASPAVWLLTLPAGLGGGLVYTLAIAYLQDLLRDRPGAGSSLIAVQRVAAEGLTTAVYGIGASLQGYATVGVLGATLAVAAVAAILRLDGIARAGSEDPP